MALNPDPKPGRWILPLVVLGMVAFTYFFVRALPGEPTDRTDTTSPAGTTAPTGTEPGGDGTTTTQPGGGPVVGDPAAQAYLEGVSSVLASMEVLQQEMAAVNGGFDADPRTVEYSEAVDRLTALAQQAQDLVAEIDALTVPPALATSHETIRNAVTTAAGAADDALTGLQSDDDGTQRRNAAVAFDAAVEDLRVAVENARSAAGLAGGGQTTETTTGDTTGDG